MASIDSMQQQLASLQADMSAAQKKGDTAKYNNLKAQCDALNLELSKAISGNTTTNSKTSKTDISTAISGQGNKDLNKDVIPGMGIEKTTPKPTPKENVDFKMLTYKEFIALPKDKQDKYMKDYFSYKQINIENDFVKTPPKTKMSDEETKKAIAEIQDYYKKNGYPGDVRLDFDILQTIQNIPGGIKALVTDFPGTIQKIGENVKEQYELGGIPAAAANLTTGSYIDPETGVKHISLGGTLLAAATPATGKVLTQGAKETGQLVKAIAREAATRLDNIDLGLGPQLAFEGASAEGGRGFSVASSQLGKDAATKTDISMKSLGSTGSVNGYLKTVELTMPGLESGRKSLVLLGCDSAEKQYNFARFVQSKGIPEIKDPAKLAEFIRNNSKELEKQGLIAPKDEALNFEMRDGINIGFRATSDEISKAKVELALKGQKFFSNKPGEVESFFKATPEQEVTNIKTELTRMGKETTPENIIQYSNNKKVASYILQQRASHFKELGLQ